MGSCYMSIPGINEKITCSICDKIIPILKIKKHVDECKGENNENRS